MAYGAFWRTGYALTNEQTGFGLGFFATHAVPYLQSLGGQGLALFFAFGAAGLAALQLLVAGAGSIQTLARTKTSLTAAAGARKVAQKEIPAGSVIIVERNLGESLDAVGRWRLVEEGLVAGMGPRPGPGSGMRPMVGPTANAADPDQPNPQQAGKNRAQQERYAGVSPSERRTRVWSDIVKWADGRPIYWFARSLDLVDNTLPVGGDYENVAEVDAPAMGGMGGPGAGMGPMMGGGPGMPGRGGRGGMPGRNFGPMPGPGPDFPPGMPGRGPGINFNAPTARLRVVKILLPKK